MLLSSHRGAVTVREIYFVAPAAGDEPSVKYFYYQTSNVTSAAGARQADDVDVGGRVYSSTTETMSRVRQLTLTESVLSRLRCIAAGGYPAPRLRMILGDRDVTDRFRRKWTRTLRGVVGMRVIDIRSELYAVDWSVDADDDEATLRCTAFVDGTHGEQFAAVSLHVRRMYTCRINSISHYIDHTHSLLSIITLRASCGPGCSNRSCLHVAGSVCVFVGLLPR